MNSTTLVTHALLISPLWFSLGCGDSAEGGSPFARGDGGEFRP